MKWYASSSLSAVGLVFALDWDFDGEAFVPVADVRARFVGGGLVPRFVDGVVGVDLALDLALASSRVVRAMALRAPRMSAGLDVGRMDIG